MLVISDLDFETLAWISQRGSHVALLKQNMFAFEDPQILQQLLASRDIYWWTWVVWIYWDVFISFLDSHSDGTHIMDVFPNKIEIQI